MIKQLFILTAFAAFLPALNLCAHEEYSMGDYTQQVDKKNKEYILKRAQDLFLRIPDHKRMEISFDPAFTGDLFSVIDMAWDVPRLGVSGEFLYYFVTGNGGSEINRGSIVSASILTVGDNSSCVKIQYRQYWEDIDSYSSNVDEMILVLHYVGQDWYIDDFSYDADSRSVKALCKQYIQEEVLAYRSGDIIDQMREDGYSGHEIQKFSNEFDAFLNKYHRQIDNISPTLFSYSSLPIPASFKEGGLEEFVSWITDKIEYPERCKRDGIEGDVDISFIVDDNGLVIDINMVHGVDSSLDYQVLNLVSESPLWSPGIFEGKNVHTLVEMTIPLRIEKDEASIPFQLVENKPSFNGGDANEFSKWVNAHLVYPKGAKGHNVSGRVTLQFTVGADGYVRNVRVVRGVNSDLDNEAVRVVRMSPRWTPGSQNDKPISVTYTFPVVFQLQ